MKNILVIFILVTGERLVGLIHSYDENKVVIVNPYQIMSRIDILSDSHTNITTKILPWIPYQLNPMEPHVINRNHIMSYVTADTELTAMYFNVIS